jgi:hypothetical protein
LFFEKEDAMAARKPIRMKRHARVQKAMRFLKSLPPDWVTGKRRISVAIGLIAFVVMVTFAYSPSAPPANTGAGTAVEAHAKREATRNDTPLTSIRAEGSADPSVVADAGSPNADSAAPAIVTITGCLERSDNQFRLNDTSGTDAPKSRSWKSGFLTRRSASVTVVPDSNDMQLSKHVGQRVTVTGPLNDRVMLVKTIRRLSTPCGTGSRVTA